MNVFEAWASRLDAREFNDAPGIPFLRMWLRRGTLEPIIARELGPNGLHGGWSEYGHAKCKAFPVGVVGHWPAGNVEIQPILSMTCALLGGNAALVRIPSGLVDLTQRLMEKLVESDPRPTSDPTHFHGRVQSRPTGSAGSNGSSRGRRDDLGRRRGRSADSGVAVSALGESGGFRAEDVGRSDGCGSLGQPRPTRCLVPAHRARCLAIRPAGLFLTRKFCSSKKGMATRPRNFSQLFGKPLKSRTGASPANHSCCIDFSDLSGARILAAEGHGTSGGLSAELRIGHCCSALDRTFPNRSKARP